MFYRSRVRENQNGTCATQYCVTEDSKRRTTYNSFVPSTSHCCLLSLHCDVIGRVKQRAGSQETRKRLRSAQGLKLFKRLRALDGDDEEPSDDAKLLFNANLLGRQFGKLPEAFFTDEWFPACSHSNMCTKPVRKALQAVDKSCIRHVSCPATFLQGGRPHRHPGEINLEQHVHGPQTGHRFLH